MSFFQEAPDLDTGMSSPALDPEGMGGAGVMMDLGAPHLSLLGMLVILLLLKWFSESDLLQGDPAQVKVSAFNILNIGLQATVFILFLKYGSSVLVRKGIVIPGLTDLAAAA